MVQFGPLTIRLEIGFHVGNVRAVELDQTVPQEVHRAHESGHLCCQEVEESFHAPDVKTLREVDVGVLVERPLTRDMSIRSKPRQYLSRTSWICARALNSSIFID